MRKAYVSDKEVLRISISDCLNNEISPGNIVAYSSGASLSFGVFEGVAKSMPYYYNKSKDYSYRIQLCIISYSGKVRRQLLGRLNLIDGEFTKAKNMVVINNPLYFLDNSDLAKCLEAIDLLKEEGHLPQDFKVK